MLPAAEPVPVSLLPCWAQLRPVRVYTQTAPLDSLSFSPPTIAVLPSPEIAALPPKDPWAVSPPAPSGAKFTHGSTWIG